MFAHLWTALLLAAPYALGQDCSNYGTASDGSCLCPPGLNPTGLSASGQTCNLPVCGGDLYQPAGAAPSGSNNLGNFSAGSCGCTDGWTGPACTVCQSSPACSNALGSRLTSLPTGLNSSLTCNAASTVYSESQMTCNVIQSTLQSLFPLSSVLTITRSLNSSLTPGGTDLRKDLGLVPGGNGTAWAQLWYDGVEQFYCAAEGCAQTIAAGQGGVNASTWTCPTLTCHCRSGATFCGGGTTTVSQDLSGPINSLTGPLEVACPTENTCQFKQSFLQLLFGSNGLELSSCVHGECVQQYVVDEALGIQQAVVGTSAGLSGGVIAGLAVIGAIVLAIIVLIIWAFLARRKARRGMRTDGVLPKGGGVGIAWSGVGYEVKPVIGGKMAKAYGWMKGSHKGRESNADESGKTGPHGGKVVLRDCGGQLPAGGFCCILGPSGAGKSTLVDILAGKRKAGRVQGRVGFVKDGDKRVKVGYVDQSDVLAPTSTVLETLIFAAQLRLPETVPKAVKIERANTVLHQLGLSDVAHTRVGSVEHRGISGGEMRRVSIGVELVAAPDVLVLDEPTSGLDSVSASRLVKLLKNLAETEQTTIVASIHQPSSALYHSFNQVCVLANGRQLYFGPGGNKPAEFFATQNRPCPEGYNVADHLLEIASSGVSGLVTGAGATLASKQGTEGMRGSNSGSSSSERISGDPFSERTDSAGSAQAADDDNGTDAETPGFGHAKEKGLSYPPTHSLSKTAPTSFTEGGADVDLSELGDSSTHKKPAWYAWPRTHCSTTFLTQIEVLSGREWRNLRRDKTLLVAHLLFACILGAFAGGLYFQINLTIAGFQNRVGSLFFLGSLIAFSSLSALYNLVEVRSLFLRERAGSFYSPQAWLLSRVLFDVIPLRVIPTIIVGVIVYFMVGLSKHAAEFFKFLLIIVEFSLAMCLFWNFLLACVFRHGGVAILLSSLANLFLMTYAGFFVNLGSIPPVLRWLRYFSTLGFALEALTVNEVSSGLMIVDSLAGVPVEIGASLIMQELFGFQAENYYRDVLVLFAYIAGFAIMLVGTVVYLLRESR